jgi:putative cell wall-binding protein
VLARGDQYADALSGVPFAATQQAPILLTEPAALRDDVKAEIKRVLTPGKTVYILGGLSAVSERVQKDVAGLGYQVVRFGGADRFHTALTIAQQGIKDPQQLYVANGDTFADAMAVGPLAATGGLWNPTRPEGPLVRGAILLTDDFRIDPDVAAYIVSRPNTAVAVGNHAIEAMKAIGPVYKAFGVMGGPDRYLTADNIAMAFHGTSAVGVATGTGWADALTGGAYLAQLGAPLIMPDPRLIGDKSWDDLTANGATAMWTLQNVFVFGGPKAISSQTYDWIKRVTHAG